MEIRYCQYCGSKLDEDGNCPTCRKLEELRVQNPDPDVAEAAVEGIEAEAFASAPEKPETAPVDASAESSESHPRPVKRNHTALVVFLVLCGICIAAAVAGFMTFSNPNDIAHYQAGNAAWKAKDWEAAQSEFSQVSEKFYKYGSVQEALRILRIEHPDDKQAFRRATNAWAAGKYEQALTYYSQISETFYRYDEVKERLRIIEGNLMYLKMAEGSWERSSTGNWMATWWDGTGSGKIWYHGIPPAETIGTRYGTINSEEWAGKGTCAVTCSISDDGDAVLKVSVAVPVFTRYADDGRYVKEADVLDSFTIREGDLDQELSPESSSDFTVTAVVTTDTIELTYQAKVPTVGGSQAPSVTHIVFVRE